MQNLKNRPVFLCLFASILVISCTPAKDLGYFRTVPTDAVLPTISKNYDIRIRPDDQLSIIVTSPATEENLKFNAPLLTGSPSTGNASVGYLVDKAGNIALYKLGTVHVQGMTLQELREKLQKDLIPVFKDPIVNVRFLNHRVTVLGEVSAPQVLPMQGQISLLEALAMAGDLKETGRRDNVLIIRQTDKGKEFKRLNLADNSIFSSPFFYLQSEDVVYIEPEKKSNQNTQQIVSYVIAGVSMAILLLDRIFK